MIESPGQNPYLFVVGCPRSGTTLLKRLVDAHPMIAMTPESHWIPNWYIDRKGLTAEGFATPQLIAALSEEHRFLRLGIATEQLEELVRSGEPVTYAHIVASIFELYAKARGKPLVGDKTPGYVQHLRLLHTLWPRARFIHLIRDGRDVALSVMDWRLADITAGRFATWQESPVSTIALWWKWNVVLGREAGRWLGADLYHEIRYESLVADPAKECASLCAFLSVPYDDAMLRLGEDPADFGPDSRKRAGLPVTPGLRDWRSHMSPEQAQRFEAAAGDLLDELGYPRAVPRPPGEIAAETLRILEMFVMDVASKGLPLPCSWDGISHVAAEINKQKGVRGAWADHIRRSAEELAALVPAGEAFVLVDEDQCADLILSGRRIPFLEREGKYWGPPEDDDQAIRELERLRQAGAGFMVFAWPAFWWLEHYTGLQRHMRSQFRCVLENERLVVFDLRQ